MPVYKGKGDPLLCASYKAFKLQEQRMKMFERVLEMRSRCQVSIVDMLFGFKFMRGTSNVEEVVLYFCGFGEQIWQSFEGGGQMGFVEAGYGLVDHPHSYGIVYRGMYCCKNRCWTKWKFWGEAWFASRVSTESTVVCCCHGCCLQWGVKWSTLRVDVCWWLSPYGTINGAAW